MIQISIVEDEQNEVERLSNYIEKYASEQSIEVHINIYHNAVLFLEKYQSNVDIIFMDIEMPMMDGMAAASKLREKDSEVLLVFITQMAQYAVDGYKVQAFDYVVKPVEYDDFKFKMNRIIKSIEMNKERELVVTFEEGATRISTKELQYIEVQGHQMTYHLLDKKLVGRGSLSNVEKNPSLKEFLRCNRCYLVNPKYIEWVHKHTVKVGEDELKISQPRRKDFMQELNIWLSKGGK